MYKHPPNSQTPGNVNVWNPVVHMVICWEKNENFRKWWVPQIIQVRPFQSILVLTPMFLVIPHLKETIYGFVCRWPMKFANSQDGIC